MLTSTVKLEYGSGIAIVGEDPATTKIKWMGPAAQSAAVTTFTLATKTHSSKPYLIDQSSNADMFRVIDVAQMKFSRLKLDGNNTARIGVQLIQSYCYPDDTPAGKAYCPNLWVLPTDPSDPIQEPLASATAMTGIEFNDNVFMNMSYGVVTGEHTRLKR